ncbi:MAG: lipoprotein [Bacilli bacterium]
MKKMTVSLVALMSLAALAGCTKKPAPSSSSEAPVVSDSTTSEVEDTRKPWEKLYFGNNDARLGNFVADLPLPADGEESRLLNSDELSGLVALIETNDEVINAQLSQIDEQWFDGDGSREDISSADITIEGEALVLRYDNYVLHQEAAYTTTYTWDEEQIVEDSSEEVSEPVSGRILHPGVKKDNLVYFSETVSEEPGSEPTSEGPLTTEVEVTQSTDTVENTVIRPLEHEGENVIAVQNKYGGILGNGVEFINYSDTLYKNTFNIGGGARWIDSKTNSQYGYDSWYGAITQQPEWMADVEAGTRQLGKLYEAELMADGTIYLLDSWVLTPKPVYTLMDNIMVVTLDLSVEH